MGLFKRRSYITINRIKVDLSEQSELPTVPDGKWIKCPGCGKTVYKEDLGALKVCPNCDGHFRISASERLAITVDRFEELFEDENIVNILGYNLKDISLDEGVKSRGYSLLSSINKITKKDIELITGELKDVQMILLASPEKISQIKGISKFKSEHIHKALARLKNKIALDRE